MFHSKYFDWIIEKLSIQTGDNRDGAKDNNIKLLLLEALQEVIQFNIKKSILYLKAKVVLLINRILKLIVLMFMSEKI